MRSTKENARKRSLMAAAAMCRARALRPPPVRFAARGSTTLQKVSGVNRRGMSAAFSGVLKRSAGTSLRNSLQPREAGLGDDALALELGLGQRPACVLDDLAARDLHAEAALEPEHEVEEVDRLGIQTLDQRDLRLDVLDVAAERVGDDLRDLRETPHRFLAWLMACSDISLTPS